MESEYLCKKCDTKKNIKEFYNNNLSICKECRKTISKEKYRKNKYNECHKIGKESINEINNKLEFMSMKLNSLETTFNELNKKKKENLIDYNLNHLKTIIIISIFMFLLNECIKFMELTTKNIK